MTSPPVDVAAFYEFAALPAYADLRAPIIELCKAHGVKGICLLAPEGINGTLAGPAEGGEVSFLDAWCSVTSNRQSCKWNFVLHTRARSTRKLRPPRRASRSFVEASIHKSQTSGRASWSLAARHGTR